MSNLEKLDAIAIPRTDEEIANMNFRKEFRKTRIFKECFKAIFSEYKTIVIVSDSRNLNAIRKKIYFTCLNEPPKVNRGIRLDDGKNHLFYFIDINNSLPNCGLGGVDTVIYYHCAKNEDTFIKNYQCLTPCLNRQGHVIVIEDNDENEFIKKLIEIGYVEVVIE